MRASAIAALLALLLVPGLGASVPLDGPAGATDTREACDLHTKRCPDGPWPALPGAPLTAEHLSDLRPLLPAVLYAALEEALDGKPGVVPGIPDDPVPDPSPLPVAWTLGVERWQAGAHLQASADVAAGGAQAHADANASLSVGPRAAVPQAGPGQVPCSDPRGCPDLVVDPAMLLVGTVEQKTFLPGHCALVEGSVASPGVRRLLRFTFTTPNVGEGDLRIGEPAEHPEWFEYSSCHGHYHFNEYADYRLWTVEGYLDWRDAREADPNATAQQVLDGHPELAAGFVDGRKQGFCAIDVRAYAPTSLAKYTNCLSTQGISTGWADEYGYSLDGQWIDISAVPPGVYVLEAETNAERMFVESDYGNNSGAVLVVLPPAAPDVDLGPLLP